MYYEKKYQTLRVEKCINQSREDCNQEKLKREIKEELRNIGILLCIMMFAIVLIQKNCVKTETFQAEATIKDYDFETAISHRFVLSYEGKEYEIQEFECTDAQKAKYIKKIGEKVPVRVTKSNLWGNKWTSLSFLEMKEIDFFEEITGFFS